MMLSKFFVKSICKSLVGWLEFVRWSWRLFVFFAFLRRISWQFRDLFSSLQKPIPPSVGKVTVHSIRRPLRLTKAKKLPEEFAESFWPTWFFSWKHFDFCRVPTAYGKIDAFLLDFHRCNALLPCLIGRSWLKLIIPNIFVGRFFLAADKMAKEFEKQCFFRVQVVYFWTFLGSYWLISLQCYLFNRTTRISWFDFFPNPFGFFRISFGEVFFVFSKFWDSLKKFSLKRLYLRALTEYQIHFIGWLLKHHEIFVVILFPKLSAFFGWVLSKFFSGLSANSVTSS